MSRLKGSWMSACVLLVLLSASHVSAQNRPAEAERAFEAATRLHEQGDIAGAIKGYEAILEKYPESADVRSNLGAAYSRLGRYEEAIAQYRQALARIGKQDTIRFNLALAYYKANWFGEAAGELSTIVADQPGNKTATLLLADCLVRLGEFKKVIDMLSPLEKTHAEDKTFAYLLGSALISDGQISRGQLLIDRVFRGEDVAEARLLIGSILLLADDGHGALKEFERAIALDPRLPSLQAWYGRALMRVGRR